jgi:hypothetical protein
MGTVRCPAVAVRGRNIRRLRRRLEYALTRLGRSLLEPIRAFGDWAVAHADEVPAAQERAAGVMNFGLRPGLTCTGL